MTTPRIYLPQTIDPNSPLELPKASSHHLINVLRLKIGAKIVLFDGQTSNEYKCTLLEIKRGTAILQVKAIEPSKSESPLTINLGQVVSRGEKMDYTIQKATELGVSSITPLFSQRCNVHLDAKRLEKKLQHWNNVIIAACEQSGRCKIPTLKPPIELSKWYLTLDPNNKNEELRLLLSPTKQHLNLKKTAQPEHVTILVGPEGGLSSMEEEKAMRNGFHAWQLGPRILRTETAALTAISILQSYFGDL